MALDLNKTKKTFRIKIDSSNLSPKSDLINPWDRPKILTNKTNSKNESKSKLQTNSTTKKSQFVNTHQKTNKKIKPIGDQLGINQGSIGGPMGGPIGDQLGINQGSIGDQLGINQGSIGGPMGGPIGDQLGINQGSIGDQLGINQGSIGGPKWSYQQLVGSEKKLIEIIFNDLKFSPSKETRPMSLDFLTKSVKSTKHYVKTVIKRLVAKQCIERIQGKSGKGGWTIFKLNETIYQQMAQNQLGINQGSIGDQLGINWGSIGDQLGINQGSNGGSNGGSAPPSSSSSINNYNNTNTTNEVETDKESQLTDEWILIQTPETLKGLGLGKSHIIQIKNQYQFTSQQVAEFLDLYAYDLDQGELDKLKTRGINPVRYFFGCLKQGGYNSVHGGFKSPEEQAGEDQMALLETRKKAKDEKRKRLEDLAFGEWREKITDDEIKRVVPLRGFETYGQKIHDIRVKDYFVQNEMKKFLEELQ